ncbi:MAG: MBL fold metallo-hydrolase [Proteobacteria bacterium]|nr:MBL fold metallo-hydrolase [Pseudomonadota bacterium]
MQNLKIHNIKTPFDFPPYHTNSYLIETHRGLYLFDTGIKSERTIKILQEKINKLGNLDGIILSHGHLDHAGTASIIADYYNVPIYISLDEKVRIGNNFNDRIERRLERLIKVAHFFGLEKKSIEREKEKANYYKNLLEPIDFCFNVEKLKIEGIEILKLPGHTSGCIGLYIKDSKVLLSGDALLKEGISPFFDPDLLTDSLSIYVQSLEKIKLLEIEKILPGHGEVIDNPKITIESHLKYIQNNMEKIQDLLKKNYKVSDIYKTVFTENQNLLISLSEIIHALEMLKIPILQNLKALLSE